MFVWYTSTDLQKERMTQEKKPKLTISSQTLISYSLRALAGLSIVLMGFMLVDTTLLDSSVKDDALSNQEISSPISDSQEAPMPYYTPLETYPLDQGLYRFTQIHTNIPKTSVNELTKYKVQEGDTIFGIAEKFNLLPETILWGNLNLLGDNVQNLRPGQEINILPVNGVLHEWRDGEGLNGVSSYYGVTPEDIINFPANHLSKDTIGDYSNPNIEPGTELIVPGGTRELISWSAPEITRDNPAVARNYGPGFCGTIMSGAVGNGSFVYPTTDHSLSGYDYTNVHRALDFRGATGNNIFAVDAGVIVYAGWNDYGYGNMVVIDHGNGWQSLYAHLDAWYVSCGQSVYQGDVIAALGNTGNSSGPHLHFELRYNGTPVNPWNILQ